MKQLLLWILSLKKVVQEAMNNLSQNKTTITIAHRLSTIKNADLIYVIDKGVIAEHGSHEDLILQKEFIKDFVINKP